MFKIEAGHCPVCLKRGEFLVQEKDGTGAIHNCLFCGEQFVDELHLVLVSQTVLSSPRRTFHVTNYEKLYYEVMEELRQDRACLMNLCPDDKSNIAQQRRKRIKEIDTALI